MRCIIYAVISLQCFLTFALSPVLGHDDDQNNRFINVFKDFLNNLPNQPYVYEDGILSNTQITGENTFSIDVSFKVSESNDSKAFKLLKCSATIQDDKELGTSISENGYQCHEDVVVPRNEGTEYDVQDSQAVEELSITEAPVEQVFVKLDNEVQSDTSVTSGEQFIAIPRQSPSAPCIGCSSFVNPSAAGVRELALLGLRHLDRHEPNARHHLNTVLQVERQVQVVNGVRYILTINIDYNNCTSWETDGCSGNQICKISILEKPWVKLADGSKFRAILANNCTEEWIFGDGEVLPTDPENGHPNKEVNNLDPLNSDSIRVVHNVEILARPKTERTLTDEDLKLLEDQIIPNMEIKQIIPNVEKEPIVPNLSGAQEYITSQPTTEPQTTMPMEVPRETAKTFVHNYYPLREINKMEDQNHNIEKLNDEKKLAIDDLMRIFDDANVNSDFKNKRKRHDNMFVGGPVEQDVNDPKYKVLAEDSMVKYLQNKGITVSHKIVSVEKVFEQVVAGTKTILDFKISPVNGDDGDVINCHSEVWEKPWINFKEVIKVDCAIDDRVKRENFLGSRQEKDANDPKYKALAEDSMAKYLQNKGITESHKIVSVEKVFEQVVAGTKTILDFKISPVNGDVINCHSEVWEKPWINFKEVIKVDCAIADRVKRENRVGSSQEKDANDPKYKALAQDSMAKYLQDKGITESHKIVSVEKVFVQIVAGTKTKLDFKISPVNSDDGDVINCHSEIWEKPWMNFKNIEVNCAIANRAKRSIKGSHHRQLVGEPHEVNFNANIGEHDNLNSKLVPQLDLYEKYKSLAQDAVLKYQQQHKTKYAYHVLKIHHATKQMVAGSLTSIDFTIAATECSPGDDQEIINKCKLRKPKTKLHCHTKISERKWLTTEEAKEITVFCDNIEKKQSKKNLHHISKKLKRSVVTTASKDPYTQIQELVNESIEKLNKDTSSEFMMRLLNIVSYEISSAARKYTSIEFDAAFTNCRNYLSLKDMENCAFLENYPHQHCITNIYPRPWAPGGKYISVNCEPEAHTERHFHPKVANTTVLLAQEALKHVEAKYPHPQKQQIVRIISHEKQLIAGIHHRLQLVIGFTDCLALSTEEHCKLTQNMGSNKICRVNVWIQPNSDHPPNFRVTCDDQNDDVMREMHKQQQAETLFLNFLTVHKPSYIEDRKEMSHRFQIFKDNINKIHELNLHERGTATYAVTAFADLTYEEFSKKHTGLRPDLKISNQIPRAMAEIPDGDIPDAFDWRDHGAVTEVKNQGSCGSCWAFSVTGNVEGQYQLKTGKLLSLSEQELVDCDKVDNGCNGGMPDNAYRAIEQLGGLETETDYPYEAADDKCTFNKTLTKVQISGAVNISSNETDMAKWLLKNGPISIGINANAMQFYYGGVSHPFKLLCSPQNLDHGVLIVGYGIKNYPIFHKRLPYWIIKNSWGPTWGEQGYYRVYRGDGSCGVNLMASSSII